MRVIYVGDCPDCGCATAEERPPALPPPAPPALPPPAPPALPPPAPPALLRAATCPDRQCPCHALPAAARAG